MLAVTTCTIRLQPFSLECMSSGSYEGGGGGLECERESYSGSGITYQVHQCDIEKQSHSNCQNPLI
jgi:hypothetical protein